MNIMKIKNFSVFMFVLFMVFIISVVPCSSANPEYKWRLSTHANPDTVQALDIEKVIERIQAESNGRIQITLYPSGQLGSFGEVYELVSKGLIELAVQPFDTFLDQRLDMSEMPYLCSTYEEAKVMLHPDNYLNQVSIKINERLGVQLFGLYGIGFGGIGFGTSVKNFPEGVFDPAIAKNMKMRIPETDTYRWVAEALNFKITVSLPIMEVFSALQTGMVDGYFGSTPLLGYLNFRDVTSHFMMFNAFVNAHGIIMNKAVFDGLPQDLKTIVFDAMRDLSIKSLDQLETNDYDAIKLFEDYGVIVHVPTEEQLNNMASIVRDAVWPKLSKQYGDEIVNGLLASLESLKK